jgi:hypothetical protein
MRAARGGNFIAILPATLHWAVSNYNQLTYRKTGEGGIFP